MSWLATTLVAAAALTVGTIVYVGSGSGVLGLSVLLGVAGFGGALARYNDQKE